MWCDMFNYGYSTFLPSFEPCKVFCYKSFTAAVIIRTFRPVWSLSSVKSWEPALYGQPDNTDTKACPRGIRINRVSLHRDNKNHRPNSGQQT